MLRASASLRTLHRPAVVSDFQRASVESTRSRWQAFKLLTWFVTAAAGVAMLTQSYPGNSKGRHALSHIQERMDALHAAFVLSSLEKPPKEGALRPEDTAEPPKLQ